MAYKTPKGWIWITLIIAIAALVLAWLAFDRTGENLEQMIENEIQAAIEEIESVDVGADTDDANDDINATTSIDETATTTVQ